MSEDTDIKPKKPMRRMGSALGAIVLLFLILILALPRILSLGPVSQAIVRKIAKGVGGELTVDSISLSWLRGQEIQGIAFEDPSRQLSANIDSVSMSSGLLVLLKKKKDLGEVVVDRPILTYIRSTPRVTSEPGDARHRGDEKSSDSAETPSSVNPEAASSVKSKVELFKPRFDIAAKLKVGDAVLHVIPQTAGRPKISTEVAVTVACTSLHDPIRVHLAVGDAGSAKKNGGFIVGGGITLLHEGVLDPARIDIQMTGEFSSFDLQSLAPLAAFIPSMPMLSGNLGGEVQFSATGSSVVTAEGDLAIRSLVVTSPALKTDRLNLETVSLGLSIVLNRDVLKIGKCSLKSPIANISISGDVKDLSGGGVYPAGEIKMDGEVDVAELSRQLPATLGLRKDLSLSGGRFAMGGRLTTESEGLGVQTRFTLSDIAGDVDGQRFQFLAPVNGEVSGALFGNTVSLESLSLTSAHGTINGSGNLTSAVVNAELDLGVLVGEVGQIVDLGDLEVGGRLELVSRMETLEHERRKVSTDVKATGLMAGGLAAFLEKEAVPDVNLELSGIVEVTLDKKTVESVNLSLAAEQLVLQNGLFKVPAPPLETLQADIDIGIEGSKINLRGLQLRSALLTASGLGEIDKGPDGVDGTLDLDLSLDESMLLKYLVAAGFVKEPAPLDGKLGLKAGVAMAGQDITIRSLALDSDAIGLSGKGQVQGLKTIKQVSLDGKLRVDYEELAQLSEALSGYRPKVSGKSDEPLVMHASLANSDWMSIVRSMDAGGGLHLPSYEAFGIAVKDLDVRLAVTNSRASVDVSTEVNEGSLKVAPFLDVSGDHAYVGVPDQSEVMKGVKLTDQMASELLGLIHPVFRGCTVIGGEMGMTLDRCHVPVDKARHDSAKIEGAIQLEKVLLSPGGMLASIVKLTKARDASIDVPDQHITFECRNGRIYPSPLEITLDEATLVLTGSVGLDKTVSYIAKVPVTEKLVGREIYPYLKGESLELHIGGTVNKPDLGGDAFLRAIRDLAKKAGKNAVVNEGLKLLEGFLGQ